jgi:uncharacterized OB-fold protein
MSESTPSPSRVIDPSLFSELDPVTLQGSTCRACSTTIFPSQATCPNCAGVDVHDVALPRSGTVWSWTVQRHEPKAPFRTDAFAPFAIGYVDLGPIIVESWLLDDLNWSIGEPVTLCLAPAWTESDPGEEGGAPIVVSTYAFARTNVTSGESA